MALLKEITNSILRITGSGTLFYGEVVCLLVDRQIAVGGKLPCVGAHIPVVVVVERPLLVHCTLAGWLSAHCSLSSCRIQSDVEYNNLKPGM